MTDKIYILLEEHRYIKPRRFSILAVFDDPESATYEFDKYNRNIPCTEYPYEIKLEEWDIENNASKN